MSKTEYTLNEFIRIYEQTANSGRFADVEPMISRDALFWFSDGSHKGIKSIRLPFESTRQTIRDEDTRISELKWLYRSRDCAVYIYHFVSTGKVHGITVQNRGRGTNVIVSECGHLKIIHEHLSLEK